MSSQSWIRVIFGLVTVAIASVPLLAIFHVIPSRAPAPGDAPTWLGVVIMLAFLLGGIMMIVNGLVGADDATGELSQPASGPLRAVYKFIGAAIVVLLAVIMTWVAFGPGERHFTVSSGFAGAAIASHAAAGTETFGRVAFGAFAIVVWLGVGAMIVSWVRRRVSPRGD